MKHTNYSYKMVYPSVVEIQVAHRAGIRLNEKNARIAIKNVRRNRKDYATEKAWQANLEMYEGALQCLLAHKPIESKHWNPFKPGSPEWIHMMRQEPGCAELSVIELLEKATT